MFSAAKLHAIYQIANAPIRRWPFPHLYVENILPPEFYSEIQKNRLNDDCFTRLVDTGRVGMAYSGARACVFPGSIDTVPAPAEQKAFWTELFDTFRDPEFSSIWLSIFKPALAEKAADLNLSVQNSDIYNEIFLMRDTTTYSLGPHTDSPRKMVSVLFYIPPDRSQAELGTSAYIPRDRAFTCRGGPHHPFEQFERVATMPYVPNTLVAFPQTKRSFHGVEPVTRTDGMRDLILFDLKMRLPGE